MVMLANTTGIKTGWLAGRYPGRIGHLFSPGAQRGPFEFVPYALDNEAFAKREKWEPGPWRKLMEWARLSGQRPLWALVPDVVGNREGTLRRWMEFSGEAAGFGWPLAFAVQDGMTPDDVPASAEVVFVGGTTDWKLRTMRMWCQNFPSVHIGRVNTYKRLMQCYDAGAKSSDGTGFLRGDQKQWRDVNAFLAETSGEKTRHVQETLHVGNFR